ncbi:MAG: hypothetical protein H8E45_08945 [Proteobacteria bacterium]|nr:hypothetical protein [Pseudomonadota bacterium]
MKARTGQLTVCRWDLDKTYLETSFESLRELIKVPFEKGSDKRAVPGVVELIRGMHRCSIEAGYRQQVFFISASPPQISRAIREKLRLDGVEYEDISFKHQVRHLVRGRLDLLREQVGFKLDRLLAGARRVQPGARELLFGDDWESDPFVYSLYADLLSGGMVPEDCEHLLRRCRVHADYRRSIMEHLRRLGPERPSVAGVFILERRQRPGMSLEAFGPRMKSSGNYLECSLWLHAMELLDSQGVVEVALAAGLDAAVATRSFERVVAAAAGKQQAARARLELARMALIEAGLLDSEVPRASLPQRARLALRRQLGLDTAGSLADDSADGQVHTAFVPDYHRLVDSWSANARQERDK